MSEDAGERQRDPRQAGDRRRPAADGGPFGAMAEAWAEAQRQVWRGWADMAATAPQGRPSATSSPMQAWQRMAEQTARAWTTGSDPVSRDVAGKVVDAQQTAMRFAGAMVEAWRELSGQATTADWSSMSERLGEQLRSAVAGPSAVGSATADMNELWQLYLAGLSRMAGPWAEIVSQSPGHLGEAMTGDHSQLRELSRLYWDAWERTGGRLLESPSLGFTREFEEDLLKGFDAWIDYRRAVLDFQVVYQAAWTDAVEAFVSTLSTRAAEGRPVGSLEELFNLWTEVTDDRLEEIFRSESYAASQGAMVNAAMEYRKHEREIVETFLKMTDIPSRSELDQAFQAIYELRRELRAMRREMGIGPLTKATAPEAGGTR